ncbi:hypothetical protein ACU686_09155 [Yinghuangia aomiensis]
MTTHERAVEVTASPDDIFHLLSDPLNMPAYVDFVEDAAPAGPDTVRITTTDLGGAKRTGLLRRGAGPRADARAVGTRQSALPRPDRRHPRARRRRLEHVHRAGHARRRERVGRRPRHPARPRPFELGGMPGHEGLALGEVGVGRTGPVDPKTEQLLSPDEVLERALAGLRDRVAVARGKVKAHH